MNSQVSDHFIRRLENWGAYFGRRHRPGTSPTYDLCESMAENAGQGYRESVAKQEIDADDAQVIEWCWCRAAYRMESKHHAMLKAFYVERSDPRLICRVLLVRYRSFDAELAAATARFYEAVAIFESVPHNSDQYNLTTVQGREKPYKEVGARP